ncbi:MAG: response regulator transcription factor [Acidimicrobiales bacterium]
MAAELASIVLVEDDPNIADLVGLYLRDAGFRVYQATDGEQGLEYVRSRNPKLVVLDVGLPGLDGLEVCRRLRADCDVPVIMLTARDGEIDRVLGRAGRRRLRAKPFSPRELVARVRAILRRTDGTGRAPSVTVVGEVEVDTGRQEVRVAGAPVALAARVRPAPTPGRARGLALSRLQLLDGVWGAGWVGDDRTVDVHVRQLRRKLGEALPCTPYGVSGTSWVDRCVAASPSPSSVPSPPPSCSWASARCCWTASGPGRAARARDQAEGLVDLFAPAVGRSGPPSLRAHQGRTWLRPAGDRLRVRHRQRQGGGDAARRVPEAWIVATATACARVRPSAATGAGSSTPWPRHRPHGARWWLCWRGRSTPRRLRSAGCWCRPASPSC